MSLKMFKNKRAARKHQSNIVLNLNAVDKQLKPCYLWDAFRADASEIQLYLNNLNETGAISNHLKAFTVDDTVFITQYDYMSNYSNTFRPENVDIVDVSKSKSKPSLLCSERKRKILSPIKAVLKSHLSNLACFCNGLNELDETINMTTLFGVLLGYPVLYWYEYQNPDVDFTCLSMVPLRVYSVSFETTTSSKCNHLSDLISFSIPEEFCDQTAYLVDSWYSELVTKCKYNDLGDLKLFQQTVTLPSVAL